MKTPAKPDNELSRLAALSDLEILDTASEERFDRLTRIAKQHFSVPIALVSLVDAERQWFKSRQGLEASETPRDISFCGHAILQADIFYIPNALNDERFADNPLVTGGPKIRFYAGAPLRAPNGERIGTLCIIDDQPHELSPEQLAVLRDLADVVEAELGQANLVKVQQSLRKKELLLRIENERLALATEAGNIGVWEYDIVNNDLNWDDRMFQLYGVSRDQFPGCYEAWSQALHPEDKARSEQELNEAISGNKPFDTEFRIVWPNGEIRNIKASAIVVNDEDDRALRMTGINQDITERKQAERKLKDNEEKIRAIVDTVVDGIITIDGKGKVQTFNPAAERIFGYHASEVFGHNIKMLMPEHYSEQHDQYLQNYLASREAKIIGIGREVEGQRKDGSRFPMELAVSEMKVGSMPMFTGIVRDVTERKKMERLKSEFVSTVSHELRTPLTSIRGALGLVVGKASQQLPAKIQKMLELANRNAERLTLLINDILDLEKIESGQLVFEFKTLDLLPLTRRAIEDNAGFADKHGVHLALVSVLDTAMIKGDEHRLLQVFSNLISNAVKYSPPDGLVEVTLNQTNSAFQISVKDHGAGIPEEFRQKIFQRFAQADSSDSRVKGGTGLGLNITKAIVERHAGCIDYESEQGKGSRFYFEIPAICPDAEHSTEKASNALVLICEDNIDVADVLAAMIEPEGVSCDIATTASKARELISQGSYQLLLLDLNLPDTNGIELLQELRASEATAELPVIVVSGQAIEGKNAVSGESMMVVDWLQKPVNPDRLKRALCEALSHSTRPRVLHIEDDMDIVQVTRRILDDIADVSHTATLTDARALLATESFDLIILDLTLADGSGIELLSDIKNQCPVVIFSAEATDENLSAQVSASLTKASTSNTQLRTTISEILQQHPKRTEQ